MLTSLSGKQVSQFVAIGRAMLEAPDGTALRRSLGPLLLDLFRADQYASFVFDQRRADDTAPIVLNMDVSNIERYRRYYQFHDPVTARMRRCGRAVHVNEVLEQDVLERTEFFTDFLARDGLCHGMNFHAFAWRGGQRRHLGDLRIWRERRHGNFDERDVSLLQAVGELFQAALASHAGDEAAQHLPAPLAFARRHRLTMRETAVLERLAEGRRDIDIAACLSISPETVRSHLKAIFQKSGIAGRAAVISALLESG